MPRDNDFASLMRSDPMHIAVALQDWLVCFTRYDRDKATEMLNVLSRVASKLGMRINKPRM